MTRRILVPLDLSRLSEAKIPVAEEHARAFQAELILLHVLPPGAGDTVSAAETQAHTFLDAIAARLRSEGIPAEPLVRSGPPAEVILTEIVEQRADMVILGSRRPQSLPQRLLSTVQSSVSEDVVARATVPLLLVPPPDRPEPEPPIRSFVEDSARAGPVAPRGLGLRTVDMARIVGSVGRAYQLDANFRSRNKGSNDEWRFQSIVRALRAGEVLPPVELYKLGYGYYVLDGNHRVAAARAIGQREIDAVVTEFVPLKDPQGQRVFAERRIFESVTGLTRVGATREGSYPRLEAMVRAFAGERGVADLREAARDWEAEVFRPVSKAIRGKRLTQRFPGERTADLFVRIAEWREQQASKLPWEAAVGAFAASLMDQIPR